MRPALAAIGLGVLLSAAVPAGMAQAAPDPGAPTRLTASPETSTVSGAPVPVHAVLRDAAGRPVAGALIRLVTTVTFMGADHEEVVDEATTDASGKAELLFAPTETGRADVTARFEGSPGYGPADATMTFDVRAPVVAYHPAPAGLQAPWARSYLILVPFLGIWVTYLLVLGQARRIRRAGSGAVALQVSSR